MKVQGTIIKLLEEQEGTSKKGTEWVKRSFVIDTKEQYNNIICFDVFGAEKVENLNKYNKVGQVVEVEFNIQTNEWQGKYYTSLQAWKINKVDASTPETEQPFETVSQEDLKEPENDLPF